MKKIILILLLSTFLNTIFSYEKYVDFDLIKKSGKYRFIKSGILFTLPYEEGKTIFIRTNLDNWEKDYYFKKSLYDINYTFINYSDNVKTIKYRLNINGFWEDDPYNNNFEYDNFGTKINIIKIPEEESYHPYLPLIEDIDNKFKSVTFKYYNPNAKEVNFVCSIDSWSQYTHMMKKNMYGYWTITKKFTKGTHYYYFFVDGEKRTDIDNPNRAFDNIRGQVSFFIIR